MSRALEFRLFSKLAELSDIYHGIQPVRMGPHLYCPAVLQWRFKQRISVGEQVTMDWSDWQGVPLVYEGMTGAPLQPAGSAPGPTDEPPKA